MQRSLFVNLFIRSLFVQIFYSYVMIITFLDSRIIVPPLLPPLVGIPKAEYVLPFAFMAASTAEKQQDCWNGSYFFATLAVHKVFFFSRAAVYFGFESFVCNCWSCTGLESFLPFFTQCADKLSISISIKGIQRRLVLLRAWGFSSHDRRDRVWDILYLVRKELYGKQSLLKKKKTMNHVSNFALKSPPIQINFRYYAMLSRRTNCVTLKS